MEQTAVEWYEIEINSLIEKYEAKEISEREFITMKHNLFYKAKELEKEQLHKAWKASEQNMRSQFSSSNYKNVTFDEQFKNK